MPDCSYASPKVTLRPLSAKGRTVTCTSKIERGEVVAILGGQLISLSHALTMSEDDKAQCIQIEDDHVLWIAQYTQSTADWINHSCSPNLGLSGQVTLVAMRDIEVGEEVCYDYAMSDGSSIDEFECLCGGAACRGKISGQDWQRPDLQHRYAGYFSPYIARRIKKLKGLKR
jgi:uncharacterized protein